MKRKKTLQQVGYVLVLLAAIIILFQRYTTQNRVRIEQRNKNYAADAAHLKAEQIDGELTNALGRINTYAYFLGEGLTGPQVGAQIIGRMEENAIYDANN